MDEHARFAFEKRLRRTQKALQAHRMKTFVVDTAAEVVPLLGQLLPQGATVTNGGSVTLAQCGALDHLRSGRYNYLDRDAAGADKPAVYLAAFSADVYLASANAVCETGEIYEIDGRGNRVAALVYGPARVIIVAGRNKLVESPDAARRRNALVSGPANCHRLGLATPCAKTGECIDCASPQRICNAELLLRCQQDPDRITIILVNEELGY